jgi:hypothetical protein
MAKRLPKVDKPMLYRALDLAMIHASEDRCVFFLEELDRQSVMLEEVLDAVDRIETSGEAAERCTESLFLMISAKRCART